MRLIRYRRSRLPSPPSASGIGLLITAEINGSISGGWTDTLELAEEDGNNNYNFDIYTTEYDLRNLTHAPPSAYFFVGGKIVALPSFAPVVTTTEPVVKRYRHEMRQILSFSLTPLPPLITDTSYNTDFLPSVIADTNVVYRGSVYQTGSSFYIVITRNELRVGVYEPYSEYVDEGVWELLSLPLYRSTNERRLSRLLSFFHGLACQVSQSGQVIWHQPIEIELDSSTASYTYSGIQEFGTRIGASSSDWVNWFFSLSWEQQLTERLFNLQSTKLIDPPWSPSERERSAKEVAKQVGVPYGQILNRFPMASSYSPTNPVIRVTNWQIHSV